MTGTLILVATAALAAVAVHLHLVARRSAARDRSGLFDDVRDLLEAPRLHRDGVGYPTLTGLAGGYPVTIRAVVDSLAVRKLPALWLEVTLHRPLPVGASLSVLLRPSGSEFFSPNGRFAHELDTPEGFPRPARVATPDPDRAPPLSVLDPGLGFLREAPTKEVALGTAGVRAVRLLAECDQNAYRVGRRAVFHRVRVARSELAGTLAALSGVGDHAASTVERC
ncbi:hypothetical protein H7X46_20155 [Pseudonocardia sp. C8]|uniref:hypothetical protein n=1 Tax=Pseudonocardia sp. C8 TaxID=2762759 RepID=UPI0016428AB7|nr:hypothetical protein [Pseudonocardia sp. C8]MBC3193378.1 hypothetical protein [Pseudonocardia sp. C8]